MALLLDGKSFAEDELVTLGVRLGGEKVVLGFVQTATENARVCGAFCGSWPTVRGDNRGAAQISTKLGIDSSIRAGYGVGGASGFARGRIL